MRKNKFAVIVDKPTLNSGLVKRLVAMYMTDKGELIATRTANKPVAKTSCEASCAEATDATKTTSNFKPK